MRKRFSEIVFLADRIYPGRLTMRSSCTYQPGNERNLDLLMLFLVAANNTNSMARFAMRYHLNWVVV